MNLKIGRTMAQILVFSQDMASRNRYKKYLYRSQDASNLAILETQLMHSFQIFEVGAPHILLNYHVIPLSLDSK